MDDEQKDSFPADGNSVNIRHNRSSFVSNDDESIPEETTKNSNGHDEADGRDLSADERKLSNLTVAQFTQLNQILLSDHSQLDIPTQEQIANLQALRQQTPELYQAFVEAFERTSKADYIERTEPIDVANEYSKRGQRYGLIAVLTSLLIVALAIYFQAYWLAGVLGTFDLVALAAVFGANISPTILRDQSDNKGREE